MKYLTLVVAISAFCSAAEAKCLIRQESPKPIIFKLANFEQPREGRIVITSGKQLDCNDEACKVTTGDKLLLNPDATELTWHRVGLDAVKIKMKKVDEIMHSGNAISNSYLKSVPGANDKYVYYLLQHSSFKLCRENGFKDLDRLVEKRCRTYEFEAFRIVGEKYTAPDNTENYETPNGEFKPKVVWADDCTLPAQPGSGGGSEPPPPPPPN